MAANKKLIRKRNDDEEEEEDNDKAVKLVLFSGPKRGQRMAKVKDQTSQDRVTDLWKNFENSFS